MTIRNLVVLVYPKTGFDVPGVSIDLPLGLLYIAAPITDDFDVRIIDQRVESGWEARLRELLALHPLVVGLTAMTCQQITNAIEVARLVREASPQTRMVWGGIHPTLFPLQVMQSGYADFVIREHGEKAFRELLIHLLDGKCDDNVPNLSGFAYGGYHETPTEREPADKLDTLPELPYHLIDVGRYIGSQGRFENRDTRSLIVLTSTGCPYRCGYCSMPSMESTRHRLVESVGHVLDRVEGLVREYSLNAIAFHDEEFLLDKQRSLDLARGLLGRFGGRDKFRWWCQTRMDSLERLELDGLALLYQSGLESFQPGIESGSDRILKLVDKRETTEQFIRINRMLAATELQPLYNFMMGLPTETVDEMKQTLQLATRLLADNPRAMVAGVYSYVPYPGTPLFDTAIACGFEPPRTLEEWAKFNRQTISTAWVLDNPEARKLAEFAVLTSRFVDGKRFHRRLSQTHPTLNFNAEPFRDLAERTQAAWEQGTVDDCAQYGLINELGLRLFEAARQ